MNPGKELETALIIVLSLGLIIVGVMFILTGPSCPACPECPKPEIVLTKEEKDFMAKSYKMQKKRWGILNSEQRLNAEFLSKANYIRGLVGLRVAREGK